MTRVLHVISGLGSGGTEGVLARLCLGTKTPDLEHGVVSLTDLGVHGGRLQATGVPVWVAPMPHGFPTLRFQKRLHDAVEAFAPSVVSGWLYRGNIAAVLASQHAGKAPLVWNIRHSLHDWSNERLFFRLSVYANRAWIDRPELVVYNSAAARDQHREMGFLPRHDCVIPNGFDLGRFRRDPEAQHLWRSRWGVGPEDLVVGLVARWHPVKNHAGFLAAARQVLDRYPRTVFVLAGDGCDAANRTLMSLVESRGLQAAVRLLGRVEDAAGVTAALDLAVNASFGEAFSNAVGEALACGVPCLATAVGDSRKIVQENGVAVEPAALAEAMVGLVGLGRAGLARKGEGAPQRMRELYSLDTMNDAYREIYSSLGRRERNE